MIFGPEALRTVLVEWDRGAIAGVLANAELQRRAVLAAFPLSSWPALDLDRYALGTDVHESFCWYLEFGTPELGSIGGGNAMKHLIFRRANGDWYFPDGYPTVDAAWADLREQLALGVDAAGSGDFAALSGLPLFQNGSRTIAKAISIYHPDSILPVFARGHRDFYMRLLGSDQDGGEYAWDGCRRLLEVVRSDYPELDDWSPVEIMQFLYRRFSPIDTTTIVKVAPGGNADMWEDARENGWIRVGWGGTGDLRSFASKEEFTAAFGRVHPYNGNQAKVTEKANEVWTLIDLKPGDVVLANKGTSRIVGIGRVKDPAYQYRAELGEFSHTVNVDWEDTTPRDFDPIRRWAFKTVARVSQADYQRILAGKTAVTRTTMDQGTTTVLPPPPPDPMLGEIERALTRKGQVILYGPPGTGKTYNARRFAVWWLARRRGHADADRLLVDRARFEATEHGLSTAATSRRAWWVVANPAVWAWDQMFSDGSVDYRYGRLQRNYALVEPGDLVIGYQANPDKRIVALGQVTEGLHTGPEGQSITIKPLSRVANGPTYEELVADPVLRSSEPIRFRNQGTLFSLTETEVDHLLAWIQERDANVPPVTADDSEAIGPLTRVTFHPSYSYEDFVEGFKPQPSDTGRLDLRLTAGVFKRVCRAAAANPTADYLLLIDEINRGNNPKIFGELITLLEKDKRGMTVVLPQSGESFSVPENVHIVGTMNTADRSIRLLDAALRRRFAFIELLPDAEPLSGGRVGDLDLAAFLLELNRRIARLEGREKQIGHSFLLEDGQPVADAGRFAQAFRYEILPLLQEYAYEDFRELADYLGTALVDVEEQVVRPEILDDPDELVRVLARHLTPKAAEPSTEPGEVE